MTFVYLLPFGLVSCPVRTKRKPESIQDSFPHLCHSRQSPFTALKARTQPYAPYKPIVRSPPLMHTQSHNVFPNTNHMPNDHRDSLHQILRKDAFPAPQNTSQGNNKLHLPHPTYLPPPNPNNNKHSRHNHPPPDPPPHPTNHHRLQRANRPLRPQLQQRLPTGHTRQRLHRYNANRRPNPAANTATHRRNPLPASTNAPLPNLR